MSNRNSGGIGRELLEYLSKHTMTDFASAASCPSSINCVSMVNEEVPMWENHVRVWSGSIENRMGRR